MKGVRIMNQESTLTKIERKNYTRSMYRKKSCPRCKLDLKTKTKGQYLLIHHHFWAGKTKLTPVDKDTPITLEDGRGEFLVQVMSCSRCKLKWQELYKFSQIRQQG